MTRDASSQALEQAGLTPPHDPVWRELVSRFFASERGRALLARLEKKASSGANIFPRAEHRLRALRLTPFDAVKVVILGQDPYHGQGQAHGLAFSVPDGIKFPPSLRNIFKELASDCDIPAPASGDLSRWAKQGVLLLNTTLTVEEGAAGAHAGWGWEDLTMAIVDRLSRDREGLVFVLWGDKAQKFVPHIDAKRHLVLSSPHPSPLSAYRGFFGSKPFSRINAYLEQHRTSGIDWSLS